MPFFSTQLEEKLSTQYILSKHNLVQKLLGSNSFTFMRYGGYRLCKIVEIFWNNDVEPSAPITFPKSAMYWKFSGHETVAWYFLSFSWNTILVLAESSKIIRTSYSNNLVSFQKWKALFCKLDSTIYEHVKPIWSGNVISTVTLFFA